MEDLILRLRSLDLLTTQMEGDDWCIAADQALQEAALTLDRLLHKVRDAHAALDTALQGKFHSMN